MVNDTGKSAEVVKDVPVVTTPEPSPVKAVDQDKVVTPTSKYSIFGSKVITRNTDRQF